ncbi:MAG TPA: alpha/beta fold hydrolase [Beijerinckiaceae bacterium]|nr:alpha/beta fold hydrolase [Beijerinckiaceae bacterium]
MSETRPEQGEASIASHPQADVPFFIEVGVPSRRIAVRRRFGAGAGALEPGILWLGGFKSDMQSTKAARLDAWAAETGRAFLRFDYSGHGESGGDFTAGTIGLWLEESLAALHIAPPGPLILVGSSMGGWIALLVARALAQAGRASRLAGMVLIAPATDFTEALLLPRLPPSALEALRTYGVWLRPSPYSSEPYPITQTLIEEGRRHLLLGGTIRSHCPVHVIQGMRDEDVPWHHAVTLVEHLAGDAATLTLVKDGDHRLSRDEDILRLIAAVAAIA